MPKLPKISLPRFSLPRLPSLPYEKLPRWLTPQVVRRVGLGTAATACVVLATMAGRHWYMASQPEYALQQIERALREHDAKRFADYVDRDSLAGGLARQLVVPNQDETGTLPPEEITKAALHSLQQLTSPPEGSAEGGKEGHASGGKAESGGGGHDKTALTPPTIPPPVPADLAHQLVESGLNLFAREDKVAIAATKVRYEALGADYPLKLVMEKGFWKWRVVGVANPVELQTTYTEAVASMKAHYRAEVEAANKAIRERMARHISITTAYAGLDTLTGGTEHILILRAEGVVAADRAPQKVGFVFRILDADATLLQTVRLVMETPLTHDGAFGESWTLSLDMERPESRRLVQAKGPLRCEPSVSMMLLKDGTILQLLTP